MAAEDFIITRKRKKYKFARFSEYENCFEAGEIMFGEVIKRADKRPITLEIGAGTAYFTVELARRHPDRFYVATDVKADRLQSGAKVALGEGLTNIVFWRTNTAQLETLVPESCVSELWLTFSDPFPKDRHAKHRLSHPRFLNIYKNMLINGGVLRQKTDNHELFDWSIEQFVSGGWHITELTFDLHESKLQDDYKILTTFEDRFVKQGLPICYLTATL